MNDVREALRVALGRWRYSFTAISVVVAIFLLLPIAIIVPMSFTNVAFLAFPPRGFSLRWYSEVLTSPSWRSAFGASIRITLGGAALATVAGTAAALSLRRLRHGGRAVNTAFVSPLIIPYLVYALGLWIVLNRFGLVGAPWAVMVGQGVLAFPLVFVVVFAGLRTVDPALPKVASSLGSRWPSIIGRIELPLIAPSVAAAALFAVVFCFDEVVVALYVTDPDTQTVPVFMWNSVVEFVTPAVAAASTLMMATAIAIFGLGFWLSGRTGDS